MRSPFAGMDPYLEHPALWPDVHNSLAAALRDAIAPLVAPRYFLALERRAYTLMADELILIGRPEAVVDRDPTPPPPAPARSGATVLEVALPVVDEVSDSFLEVRDIDTGTLVTVLEILSPGNKIHRLGRQDYLVKRARILRTRTNLVEVDLLRAGEPMPLAQPLPASDHRILVSRSTQRPPSCTCSASATRCRSSRSPWRPATSSRASSSRRSGIRCTSGRDSTCA